MVGRSIGLEVHRDFCQVAIADGGRARSAGQIKTTPEQLPIDERLTVDAGLRQLDFVGAELAQIDRIIAQQVLVDEDVRRLMTIPGIDVIVGYLGLHPTIRQSGNGPARHGRVSKEGSAAARGSRRVRPARRAGCGCRAELVRLELKAEVAVDLVQP